jgi:hypothetical protein
MWEYFCAVETATLHDVHLELPCVLLGTLNPMPLHVFSESPNVLLPLLLIAKPGVVQQLLGGAGAPVVTSAALHREVVSALDHATQYQQTATSVRIGNTVRTGANTGVNRNLERAQILSEQVIRERKEKRARDVAGSINVHVYVYMWKFNGKTTSKAKMQKVMCSYNHSELVFHLQYK